MNEMVRGYQCITCGERAFPEDLCSCCSRCIDCVNELGHRKRRVVADEVEEYDER
jgi:hypothetical protein